jgi:hypothetical protein
MISVLSVTDRYILQPSVIAKHKKTLDWISATILWKQEVAFFQKLVDQYASRFTDTEDKKRIGHFQSIITYYHSEVLNYVGTRLREHERKLALSLEQKDETNTAYFKEHETLMAEMEALNAQLADYKIDLFRFIEKVM